MKRPLLAPLFAVCALVVAGPAHADGLLSGVLPGLVSPSDTPAVCDPNATQAFARWGDYNYYVLAPGGAFEPGGPDWKLHGGARVVRGNERFYVRSRDDDYALFLPDGSTATSPPMCFDFGNWHFRFFTSGEGSVRVTVMVRSLLGVLSSLDGGTVRAGDSWRPSPEVELLLSNVSSLVSTDSVSIRLTPVRDSDVRIDDVYLDPWKVG